MDDLNSRTLTDEEILEIPEEDVEKIERVCSALAEKDRARRWRETFEKASEEAVPFIIYVIYNSYLALIVLFRLLEFEGQKFYAGLAILALIIIAPLFILSGDTIKSSLSWVKQKIV